MPPVMIDGFLERKQQIQSGGKRSTIRSWKTYYTVLSGQLLCFFKDQNDFKESKAASPPILIQNALIEDAKDYTKKKHVIRLVTQDSSEYLFDANTSENQKNWIEKLVLSSHIAPAESVKRSAVVDLPQSSPTTSSTSASFIPPMPTSSSEPLYENVAAAAASRSPSSASNSESDHYHQQQQHQNNLNNHHNSSGDHSELDGREKKSSKLSKFLGRKHRVPS